MEYNFYQIFYPIDKSKPNKYENGNITGEQLGELVSDLFDAKRSLDGKLEEYAKCCKVGETEFLSIYKSTWNKSVNQLDVYATNDLNAINYDNLTTYSLRGLECVILVNVEVTEGKKFPILYFQYPKMSIVDIRAFAIIHWAVKSDPEIVKFFLDKSLAHIFILEETDGFK